MAEQGMTPTTPPLSMLFAFHAALQMIHDEGIEQVWQRHHRLAELTRAGVRAAGLRLFAQEGFASDSVTAFLPPPEVTAKAMLAMLRDDYGVEAQGGQGHLADSLIRVGHMGWVHEREMREAVEAIAAASERFRRRSETETGPDPPPLVAVSA